MRWELFFCFGVPSQEKKSNMSHFLLVLLSFTFFASSASCEASEFEALNQIPIAYKGRFRPLDAALALGIVAEENGALLTSEKEFWRIHFSKNIYINKTETKSSLVQRLNGLSTPPLALPSKAKNGQWISLQALALKEADGTPIGNFTAYSLPLFKEIQNAYLALEREVRNEGAMAAAATQLSALLMEGYDSLEGHSYALSKNKALYYPSRHQLQAESLYYRLPWVIVTAGSYLFATLLWIFSFRRTAFIGTLIAFVLNTALLVIRCYILQRPPVTSMFETVLFVPWVAMVAGFLLQATLKTHKALVGAVVASTLLFAILLLSGMTNEMENVQAVLDSQYWLMIHVLMVVGSYGVFALAGILGHFYLVRTFLDPKRDFSLLSSLILQALYIGTALLVVGTILGGIWAAQSWGRFWDWDPKESWAFISSSFYLICIHAYRFNKMGPRGLAVGAIIGLLSITFTWYGVNYILGTGLHSYGFGSGGEPFYFAYLVGEVLFLGGIALCSRKNSLRKKSSIL